MSRAGLVKAGLLCCALALALVATAAGSGALVRVNGLILRADGDVQPHALPRRQFAPIDFQGHFDIAAQGGGQPSALEGAVIDFDRDGRLTAGGLPTCAAERVANAGPVAARQICPGAIVGSGRVEAQVAGATTSSALTLFNGPLQEGNPTVVLHARFDAGGGQVLAIVVPIERRPGPFRYRATLDLPPIAAGLGTLTHVEVKIGRRFSSGGQRRSYVSARCSDGILQTHGRFTFAEGTIIDGAVEKACTPR